MILWYFWIYSFLGFLLEKAFAAATHSPHPVRRCFLLLPLCPVYGLGMLAVLSLPEGIRPRGMRRFSACAFGTIPTSRAISVAGCACPFS